MTSIIDVLNSVIKELRESIPDSSNQLCERIQGVIIELRYIRKLLVVIIELLIFIIGLIIIYN